MKESHFMAEPKVIIESAGQRSHARKLVLLILLWNDILKPTHEEANSMRCNAIK